MAVDTSAFAWNEVMRAAANAYLNSTASSGGASEETQLLVNAGVGAVTDDPAADPDADGSIIAKIGGMWASVITAVSHLLAVKTAVEAMESDTSTMPVSQDTSAVANGGTSLTPKFAAISSTGSGDTLALVTGKKIRVLSMFFVVAGATTVKFQTGASTDLTGAMSYAANDGIALAHNPLGWFETTAGAKLNHVLGTSVAIAGGFTYIEV